MRKFLRSLLFAAAVSFAALPALGDAIVLDLTGDLEVPAVDTAAFGSFVLIGTPRGQRFTLTANIVDAVAAHIHCAPPGGKRSRGASTSGSWGRRAPACSPTARCPIRQQRMAAAGRASTMHWPRSTRARPTSTSTPPRFRRERSAGNF